MTAPFGIELGSHSSSLNILDGDGRNYAVEPPKPHPQFPSYFVETSPTFGVVSVKAVSDDFDYDAYGNQARDLADRVAGQLSARYGSGTKNDYLFDESIWDQPQDWATGMQHGDRGYFYLWERATHSQLPADLAQIMLFVMATDTGGTKVVLSYQSDNFAAAESERDSDLSDLL